MSDILTKDTLRRDLKNVAIERVLLGVIIYITVAIRRHSQPSAAFANGVSCGWCDTRVRVATSSRNNLARMNPHQKAGSGQADCHQSCSAD